MLATLFKEFKVVENYAIRVENQRFSFADFPCGTGHGYKLEIFGVPYQGSEPFISIHSNGRDYIEGPPVELLTCGPISPSYKDALRGVQVTRRFLSGMYVYGDTFAYPDELDTTQTISSPIFTDAVRRLIKGGEECEPVVITFADRPAVNRAIRELHKTKDPNSYENMVMRGIKQVVNALQEN